jgi:hypothetical protein
MYYCFDFNLPANNRRPNFIYSHNRHNEVNLNLGYLKAAVNETNYRAALAIAAGTYMEANYAAEDGLLKNVLEAWVGLRLSKKKNLWLEAGIFPSHIGFESAVAKDCATLTRSLQAENSPYFEAGAKLIYTTDADKWMISLLWLNGWQRIKRVDGNSLPAFAAQVQYKPTTQTLINYSNFIGSDQPDSSRRMRYFQNFYLQQRLAPRWMLTCGFDWGLEQQAKGSKHLNSWYSPIVILQFQPTEKWSLAARAEYYSDQHAVLINTGTRNGFQTAGFSINLDYKPVSYATARIELRNWQSRDAIFTKDDVLQRGNSFLTFSLAASF